MKFIIHFCLCPWPLSRQTREKLIFECHIAAADVPLCLSVCTQLMLQQHAVYRLLAELLFSGRFNSSASCICEIRVRNFFCICVGCVVLCVRMLHAMMPWCIDWILFLHLKMRKTKKSRSRLEFSSYYRVRKRRNFWIHRRIKSRKTRKYIHRHYWNGFLVLVRKADEYNARTRQIKINDERPNALHHSRSMQMHTLKHWSGFVRGARANAFGWVSSSLIIVLSDTQHKRNATFFFFFFLRQFVLVCWRSSLLR